MNRESAPLDPDFAVVDAAMARLAAELVPRANLRTAPQLLLRARLEARRQATERSLRPLLVWQRVAAITIAVAMLLALVLGAPLFGGFTAAGGPAPTPARLLAGIGLLVLATLPFAQRLRRLAS
jgi:hypothetical protein